MEQKASSFSLIVPADLLALRTVQAFVSESADLYGFEEKTRFSLIAEEAFVHHLSRLKREDSDSPITVRTSADEKYFIISFSDKGMPFGSEKELDRFDKTELAIIRANCTRLDWVNHGKGGKEMRILISRPQKDITQYELPFETTGVKTVSSENIVIERLNTEYCHQISMLIYKTYGYSYPNDDLYYPETIKRLNETGKLISVVARDVSADRIVGHYALEIYDNPCVAEFGQAAVDTDYRGFGILIRLRDRVEKAAVKQGIHAVFSQPVTSHIRTQKTNEKFGSRVCGISFGLVPKELNFRKMGIQPLAQRETCMLCVKVLEKGERTVFVPREYEEIVSAIYENINLPFQFGPEGEPEGAASVDSNFYPNWGFGKISVLKIGRDFSEKFSEAVFELRYIAKADIIFLDITVNCPGISKAVGLVEQKGFFFVGLAPALLNGADAIRFEYMNTLIDTSRIIAYSGFAKRILKFCSEKMREALM
ncbi:MAG: hypothetical protein GXO70_07265 [Acidobacteria bacterium]|nr:hypothetical protein [Acidobacteriota bacterium]